MLITSIEELRLASPAHALDSIDPMVGFIDNSEHDFLEDKLGTPLYNALCEWYERNQYTRSSVADYQTGYWNRLLLMAQRVVAFDALGRSAGMQGVSVNNAGINQMVADDYPKADEKAIATYRDTCTKEAHSALNQLLRQLEQWCKEPAPGEGSVLSDFVAEKEEIVALWHHSRYYYIAAQLLIPSCETLQAYLNIYDSREKFVQLLPDLQFIQEEQIQEAVGEDLMQALIAYATDGTLPVVSGSPTDSSLVPLFDAVLHRLRKVVAALLAGRTAVLKYTKEQKIQYHDDGVRMFETAINYLRGHQADFPEDLIKTAPWYVAPAPAPAPSQEPCPCAGPPDEHSRGAACWTPPLF